MMIYLRVSQMTGYMNKIKDKKAKTTTATMSLMVKDKQLLKNYNKIWEKNWKVNDDKFW